MAKDIHLTREELEEAVKRIYGSVLYEARHNYKGGKLSQEKLADAASYDRTYIYKLENGDYQPTLSAFIMIADQLGISPVNMLKSVLKELD